MPTKKTETETAAAAETAVKKRSTRTAAAKTAGEKTAAAKTTRTRTRTAAKKEPAVEEISAAETEAAAEAEAETAAEASAAEEEMAEAAEDSAAVKAESAAVNADESDDGSAPDADSTGSDADDEEEEDDSGAADDAIPVPETAEEREQLIEKLKKEAERQEKGGRRRSQPAPARPGVFRARRSEQDVVAINPGRGYEDPAAAARDNAKIEVFQSLTRKTILTGKVIGVNRLSLGGAGNYLYYVQVKTDKYEVLIPYDRFTATDFEELHRAWQKDSPGRTLNETIERYLRDRLNAEVDFVVAKVEPDDDPMSPVGMKIAGDRLEAMYRRRITYWFGKERGTSEYWLRPGTRVEARVTMTARSGIRVEVFGVETFIPNRDLDYTFIQDARTEFEVGSHITVVITSVNRDEDNDNECRFTASVRDAKPDPRERALSIYTPGNLYAGVVNYLRVPTTEHPNVRPAVFVKLAHDGVQVSCPFPNSPTPPMVGARCNVIITNQDPKNNWLFGIIQHISPVR